MTDRARSVAIVGNGAAGALLVTSLLREAVREGTAMRVEWIGDGPTGRGIAYATTRPWHRLNVAAAGMSLAEADTSFPDWLEAHPAEAQGSDPFAPRHAFGSYLLEVLDAARRDAAGLVDVREHACRAVDLQVDEAGVRLGLDSGGEVRACRAVLALGPFPGPGLPGSDETVMAHPRVVADPWDGGLDDIDGEATVLLVGTGLTMVDVALSIGRSAPDARMLAVSRTGLLPRDHDPDEAATSTPAVRPGPGLGLDRLVGAVEAAVDEAPERWRDVVDGLRPVTQGLWRALPDTDRRRFLVEQARRWEVHRHRMAPSVAAELHGLVDAGRLRTGAARVRHIEVIGERLRVHLDGDDGPRTVDADRVVSCTGAQDDPATVDDPLVAGLLERGHARAHPLGLGFDTDADGALRTTTGAHGRLHTLGTPRRGELYETTAVPEIREQAEALGRLLIRGSRAARP